MLQHVSLEVRPEQLDACVAFWRLLGFEQVTPPPLLRDRFTWLERAGTQIHLMPFSDPVTTERGHAAVVVEDYEATLRALHEQGSRRARVPTRGGRRARSCATRPATTSS